MTRSATLAQTSDIDTSSKQNSSLPTTSSPQRPPPQLPPQPLRQQTLPRPPQSRGQTPPSQTRPQMPQPRQQPQIPQANDFKPQQQPIPPSFQQQQQMKSQQVPPQQQQQQQQQREQLQPLPLTSHRQRRRLGPPPRTGLRFQPNDAPQQSALEAQPPMNGSPSLPQRSSLQLPPDQLNLTASQGANEVGSALLQLSRPVPQPAGRPKAALPRSPLCKTHQQTMSSPNLSEHSLEQNSQRAMTMIRTSSQTETDRSTRKVSRKDTSDGGVQSPECSAPIQIEQIGPNDNLQDRFGKQFRKYYYLSIYI